jgi:hypothetical protein
MPNDKWIGEGIVRLLGHDGRAFVQGADNQDVETAGILPGGFATPQAPLHTLCALGGLRANFFA